MLPELKNLQIIKDKIHKKHGGKPVELIDYTNDEMFRMVVDDFNQLIATISKEKLEALAAIDAKYEEQLKINIDCYSLQLDLKFL